MSAIFAAYPVHDQFKDTTFTTQWGHMKESLLPALENDVSPGARTTDLAVSTDFRFQLISLHQVLVCRMNLFYYGQLDYFPSCRFNRK
jgi:hypothetical protein